MGALEDLLNSNLNNLNSTILHKLISWTCNHANEAKRLKYLSQVSICSGFFLLFGKTVFLVNQWIFHITNVGSSSWLYNVYTGLSSPYLTNLLTFLDEGSRMFMDNWLCARLWFAYNIHPKFKSPEISRKLFNILGLNLK